MRSLLILFCCLAIPSAFAQVKHAKHHREMPALAVRGVAEGGLLLYLSDGSAWEVRRDDAVLAAKWPVVKRIAIYRTNDAIYPYRIVVSPGNPDGQIVSAKRLQRVK